MSFLLEFPSVFFSRVGEPWRWGFGDLELGCMASLMLEVFEVFDDCTSFVHGIPALLLLLPATTARYIVPRSSHLRAEPSTIGAGLKSDEV